MNKEAQSLLIDAIHARYLPRVRALLARPGLDVNARDDEGYTPLMWAARHGYPEIVRLLLDAGAEPTLKDPLGYTAADIAMWYGEYRMMAYTRESQKIVAILRKAGG